MIIGLCGPKGSGKTTLALKLQAKYDFCVLGFAEPIRRMVNALTTYQRYSINWASVDKEEPVTYLGNKSIRYAMQTLGTEWGRNLIHPDLWVSAWKNAAEYVTKHSHLNIVADDLRFLNEEQVIRELGGIVVKINRPGYDNSRDAHYSEQEHLLIRADITIDNDGSKDQLFGTLVQGLSL